MSFLTKYNNTSAEIFKLRMQLKAEINDLRKTYEEIVFEKPPTKKKIFEEKLTVKTYLMPEQKRSTGKTSQKRHFSPTLSKEKENKSLSSKRQYNNIRNSDSLKQVLKHQVATRRRSPSPAPHSKHNMSMCELSPHNESMDGLKIGLKDSSVSKQKRTSKRIIPKYHQYKYDLLLG